MIGSTVGRYRVISRLGKGGIADIWRAHDTLLGRQVALKLLNVEFAESAKARRRFLHEARAMAALDHPGIITIHEHGESEGRVFIALALIEGETVSELASRRLMPITHAVRIAEAAADALEHAHTHGVIHRDVTGRNIMVARDGRVVVLDFGLALAAWESRVTTTDVAMGTAPYMAPEVIQANSADVRSDVYGLGVVLYEALTGTFPFTGELAQSILYSAANLDPTPPRTQRPDLPPELESVILRAIARDPAKRFQTAAELKLALHSTAVGADEAAIAAAFKSESGMSGADTVDGSRAHAFARTPRFLAILPFALEVTRPLPPEAARTLAERLAGRFREALGGIEGLRIVPGGETPDSIDAGELARGLGANVLLRGAIQQTGTEIRVRYRLFDPWRGVPIADEELEGSGLQLQDLEDRVLESAVRVCEGTSESAPTRPVRPRDPAAAEHYLQALAYLKRYDNEASVDGSISLLERLVASEGALPAHQAALARAYLCKLDLTQERIWESRAAAACERARQLAADIPEVRLALGLLELHTGQTDSALEHLRRVPEVTTSSYDAKLGLARVLHDAGRYVEAESACRTALALEPEDWRGHSLLGSIFFRSGRFRDALEPWARVIELTPDNTRGYRNLGNAYYRLDRWEDAVAAYRRSLAIQPNRDAYTNLGTTLYYLGREQESLEAFRLAAELTPTNAVGWGNLGSACRGFPGHEAEAEAALERAIVVMREQLARNPAEAEHFSRLAGWLANLGRLDEAREAAGTALRLAPEDMRCQVFAAHAYFQLGDRAECLRLLAAARRGGYGAMELRQSREFAPLRGDPEFTRLLDDASCQAGPYGEIAGVDSS